jgi:low temperature requirement protein LtrA
MRLRSSFGADARKVTWPELFFDLIFVAAVAQVAEPLREHYALAEVARLTPLFVLVWWAWTGHTVFSTRFDSRDGIQRLLTVLQMFAVAAMAANAKDALDSRSSAGFAAAYAAMRFVLVGQYFRARGVPGAAPLATRYLLGHGAAATLWMASAFIPAPGRFVVWAIAFLIDLATPWLAIRHSVSIPPDEAHLPERFGLFMLILLGDAVISVMQGMESQETWTPEAALSAFLGMAILFMLSWWYFDGSAGAAEQPVRTRAQAVRFHVWSYAHLPLYLATIVTGVGLRRIVTAASRATLDGGEILILTGALSLAMAAVTTIGATSAGRQRDVRWWPHATLMLLTLLSGFGGVSSPVILVLVASAACVGQLAVSLESSPFARCEAVARRGDGRHRAIDDVTSTRCLSPTTSPPRNSSSSRTATPRF